jgi:hypothetical protein
MVALAGSGWQLAPCLVSMYDEANRLAPNRNRKADGSIGDTAHASRTSDHNPANGFVTALDLTHAPETGFDAHARARMVIARRDQRIKYVISNRMIARSYSSGGSPPWTWKPYTGSNPHVFHAHFSVNNTVAARNNTSAWWPHSSQEDELTMAQIDEIMAKLEVIHTEQTKQHSRVVELLDAIPVKVRNTVYTARDGLAKLIRELHG